MLSKVQLENYIYSESMTKFFATLAVLIATGSAVIDAHAKSINLEKFYLGGRVGRAWTKYTDPDSSMILNGRGTLGTLAIGYNLDKEIRTELECMLDDGLKSQKFALDGTNLTVKTKSFGGFVNSYYDFNNHTKFTPYIYAGLGWLKLNLSETRINSPIYNGSVRGRHNIFAWQFGLGMSYKVAKNVSIDLGYRYLDRAKRNFKLNNADGTTAILRIKPTHIGLFGVRVKF
jgi:opacity protein-like surface antigen